MAPLEGLTGHIYRRAYEKYFGRGQVDKYFIPFISPNSSDGYTTREVNDINPDNNKGMVAIPQIMANNTEYFLKGAAMLKDLGYNEINLNVGCPSGTVVSKYRGAGFLAIPDELDRFLYEVLDSPVMAGVKMSVKTRLGMTDEAEFERLLEIYNRYDFNEIIIHARVRADKYNGTPRMGAFEKALSGSKNQVCYNGDVNTCEDFVRITDNYGGKINAVMLGRGLIADPALINVIAADNPMQYERDLKNDKKNIKAFMQEVFLGYLEAMDGDPKAMHKMKEIWVYMGSHFIGGEKILKDIKKAQRINDYTAAVETFFANAELKG
ncbi:MAG: tRNA-dihydrouridine synthase family protein [Lachnospira sp.]|nr:tRNA-dihydrouridine synthase family protein [Lachnospira sp.]